MPNLAVTRVGQFRPRQCLRRIDPQNPPIKSNTELLAVIQPKLYRFERLPSPAHAPREQPISAVGNEMSTIFGMDIAA